MKLRYVVIDDWKEVLKGSWTTRAAAVLGVLAGLIGQAQIVAVGLLGFLPTGWPQIVGSGIVGFLMFGLPIIAARLGKQSLGVSDNDKTGDDGDERTDDGSNGEVQ